MNWSYFGLSVFGVLFAIWLVLVLRRRWSPVGLIVSLACLLGAGLNGAAPVRGLVDPDYIGYSFGLIQAERGWPVTLIAGVVFIACALSAFIAASVRRGAPLWIVALTTGVLTFSLGAPWLESAFRDPEANKIQFGEYLTIPGPLSTVLLFVLIIAPFATGAIWAARGAAAPSRT